MANNKTNSKEEIRNLIEGRDIKETQTETINYSIENRMLVIKTAIGGIEFVISAGKVRVLDEGKSVVYIKLENSENENAELVLEMKELDTLPVLAEAYSWYNRLLPWDDENVRLLDFLKGKLMRLPNWYASHTHGVIYDESDEPRYYYGSEAVDLKNIDQQLPVLDTGTKACFNGVDRFLPCKSKGKLSDVMDKVNAVVDKRIAVQSILAAALSAIICGILKLSSYTFCISGHSSTGKTTIQNLAASFYGRLENSKLVKRFSATPAKLFDSLKNVNGAMVMIDDTSSDINYSAKRNSSGEHNLANLVHFVSGNVGRQTKNDKDEASFHTMVLMSSEKSIVDSYGMHNNGSRRRVVELMMGTATPSLTKDAAEAVALNRFSKENYGVLSVEFVKHIIKNIGIDELRDRYNSVRTTLQDQMKVDGISQGYAETISSIVLAAEIASEMGMNFDAEGIGLYLIAEFERSENRYKNKGIVSVLDFKKLYTACAVLALRYNKDECLRTNAFCVLPKDTDQLTTIFNCNWHDILTKLVSNGVLKQQDGKHYGKKRAGVTGRVYEIKYAPEFFMDEDAALIKDEITLTDEFADAFIKRRKKHPITPELSVDIAEDWDISVVEQQSLIGKGCNFVRFSYKHSDYVLEKPYKQLIGSLDVQRELATATGNMTPEMFREVREYVARIMEVAHISKTEEYLERELLFLSILKQVMQITLAKFRCESLQLTNNEREIENYERIGRYEHNYYREGFIEFDKGEKNSINYQKKMIGINEFAIALAMNPTDENMMTQRELKSDYKKIVHDFISLSKEFDVTAIQLKEPMHIEYDAESFYMRESDENGNRHSFYTSLLSVAALKWRNRAAFEVASVICSLAERRGSFHGGKAELCIDTLMKQCPLFAHRYNKAVGSKKNEVLKTVICKALEYLNSDCVFEAKYKNIKIELPNEMNRFRLRDKIIMKVGKKNGK